MPREETITRIRVPMIGSYGRLDQGIPEEQVERLRATLAANGVAHDVKLYDGAEHGFCNETREGLPPAGGGRFLAAHAPVVRALPRGLAARG